MPPPAKKAPAARAARQPIKIETVGVDDVGGGDATIKALILGAPDAGKTRWASAFPRPLYLACEPTVGASIASRKIDYEGGPSAPHIVRIHQQQRPSDAMLDTLDMLAELPRKKAPGGKLRYQTAVLDTADGLSRLFKDEWAAREGAAMFTGRDAWGFLEAKFSLVMTRLLNLPMNVIVLCHLKDRDVEEQVGESTQRRTIYEPLLQGASKDNIYNDFDLIGLMQTLLVGDQQYRGISFDPTPTYPFLKDHYALDAPGDRRLGKRFWPITMDDGTKGDSSPEEFVNTNFGALKEQMIEGLDGLPEATTVEDIPEAGLPSAEGVVAPNAGGPVAGAADVPKPPPAAAKAPAKKAAAPAAKAPAKAVAPAPGGDAAPATVPAPSGDPAFHPAADGEGFTSDPAQAAQVPASEAVPGGSPGGDSQAAGDEAAPVEQATSGSDPEPSSQAPAAQEIAPGTSVAADGTDQAALNAVQETLGGEVVDVQTHADNTTKEGHCPICGKDMSNEQPDLVQLSRLKHRTLVLPDGRKFYDTGGCCYEDYQALNQQKANGTGLYA